MGPGTENHSTATKTTGTQRCRSELFWSGTMAMEDGRLGCAYPSLQSLSRSHTSLTTTVNVCESLRDEHFSVSEILKKNTSWWRPFSTWSCRGTLCAQGTHCWRYWAPGLSSKGWVHSLDRGDTPRSIPRRLLRKEITSSGRHAALAAPGVSGLLLC